MPLFINACSKIKFKSKWQVVWLFFMFLSIADRFFGKQISAFLRSRKSHFITTIFLLVYLIIPRNSLLRKLQDQDCSNKRTKRISVSIGFGKTKTVKQTPIRLTCLRLNCNVFMENNTLFNLIDMRKKVLFTIALLLTLSASAQQLDQRSITFLNWFFTVQREIQVKRNFYLPQLNKYQIAELKKLFKSDTLHHLRLNRTDTAKFMLLSAKDKVNINQQIEKLAAQKLPQKVLPQFEFLDPDTLKSFGPWHTFWQTVHQKGINGYYTFSRPIFFSNEKYCVFFWDFSCGSLCGYGNISIYRKTKVGWEEYIVLSNWIS